jgi:hypothetical protein
MRVAVEVDGHVLLIGIDRPEKRNAFDLATIEQLSACGSPKPRPASSAWVRTVRSGSVGGPRHPDRA